MIKKELTDQLRFSLPAQDHMANIIDELDIKENSKIAVINADNGFVPFTMIHRAEKTFIIEEYENVLDQFKEYYGTDKAEYMLLDEEINIEDNSVDYVFINVNELSAEQNEKIYGLAKKILKEEGILINLFINSKVYEDIIYEGKQLELGMSEESILNTLNDMFTNVESKDLKTYNVHLVDDEAKEEESSCGCGGDHDHEDSCGCGSHEEDSCGCGEEEGSCGGGCGGCSSQKIPDNAKLASIELKYIIAK